MDDVIKIENVQKYYGKNRGVERVSFTIKAGEIYGLIGPNGAGKTTTLRLLLGLLKKDKGRVEIGGEEVKDGYVPGKNKIGYLPGEVNFYDNMSVKEFLRFNGNFYRSYDKSYEKELCEFLDLDTSRKFKELSQGNKKKVGIVQALAHKPNYLILDEPTNGLDPLLQKRLYKLIEDEREKGTAVLFSSHVLSEVERLCKTVGVIKQGVLIKELAIDQIHQYAKKTITVFGLSDQQPLQQFQIIEETDDKLVFTVKRNTLKAFLTTLNRMEYDDLQIRNPTLEEAFMEFYGKEES